MKLRMILIIFFVGLTSLPTMAQDQTVTLKLTDVNLYELFDAIRKQTGLRFIYNAEQMKEVPKVSVNVENKKVKDVLTEAFSGTSLTFEYDKDVVTVVKKEADKSQPQVKLMQVSGRVVDEKGNPIPGVSVVIHGTTQGVATDIDGRFALMAKPTDILSFSFIGYKTELTPIKGKDHVNMKLHPTAENLEEVTVVAFGEQKKESVVAAITTVRPMDLKTSNSDLTASLAGKVAGIVGWQTGGLPGALTEEEMNTKFYIRGITSFQTDANIDPLILLDGVESSKLDLSRIAPEDIETFSVMKDASATAMYGARGANGVILVTTKRGEEGSVYTSFRYEAIASMPTDKIEIVDPITYMKMYNQALLSRNPSATPKYSVEHIERTASGKYPSWVYPKNDWYDILFKKMNVNHHFGLNIRGGSKIVQYYASLNHNRDQGMLKTDRLNQFDVNIKHNNTTFRVNLTIDLNVGIKLLLNSSASLDKYHGPRSSVQQAYRLVFNASPVDFAAMYPADDTYNWPHLRFGTTTSRQVNPYMSLHAGYLERSRYSTINRVEYIQNLSRLVKGLEIRGIVSLNQGGYYMIPYSTSPFMYALSKYDFETGKHTLQAIDPEYSKRTLDIGRSESTSSTQIAYEARLLHTAAWGGVDKDKHQTSLTAVFQAQESTGYPVGQVLDGFPYRNLGFSMRASYGFKNRYFIEGSFGYNGSERFAQKNKMGFFPAIGGAWVVSSEKFMQSLSNVVSHMKLRVSYGQVGNDGIITSPRFVYLPTINVEEVPDPEPYTLRFPRYIMSSYPNEDIKWEIAEQVNFGLEAGLFKGKMDLTLDVYQEIRHNVLAQRTTIPSSMGLEEPPLDNIGKTRSRGYDFSGKFQHAFSNDCWVILNGTLTYNKTTYLEIEESENTPSWQTMKGKEISQQIGYVDEGLFMDQAEIDNSPTQGGDLMPGDIRYRDLNNDGVIDVNDATYIGFPETPRVTYGFSGFVNYKNWEFSMAFQGSGKRSFFMNPAALSPFTSDHAMLKAIYDDHWSEDNMSKRPFWPRLSTGNHVYHNPQEDWYNMTNPSSMPPSDIRKSSYFMRECRFLRCTSIELGYNLPKKFVQRYKMQNVKFYARANNPFLLSNFKIWDVELGESGFNYPIQKTYSVGLNVSF